VLFDLPLSELEGYRPTVAEPADFDAFWREQTERASRSPLDARFEPVATPLRAVDVFDASFTGHGGVRVAGWLLLPRACDPEAPVVVEFIGYNGGRGRPLDWLPWSAAGYPHFVMDTRGQGSGWRSGVTADPSDTGAPSAAGYMTRGIASPETSYYTRLFVDAARAVSAATGHPRTAGRRVVTTGTSQGGGLALAAAHLGDGVAATLPAAPFLAHFRRAFEVTDSEPYAEIAQYCSVHVDRVDDVFATLSYIDVVNHARRIEAPALFSAGLYDDITPPSTVFAAYNHYAGPKRIEVYAFNGHEGGGTVHLERQLRFVGELTATPA
jgi:cephalosporin-C deacetylase